MGHQPVRRWLIEARRSSPQQWNKMIMRLTELFGVGLGFAARITLRRSPLILAAM